jgi:micrococcal nuclease
VAEIDAPERRQPWGERARQRLAGLCFGKKADLVPATTDRYGRTVARVSCNSVDAGEAMVRDGYAWRYTPYSTTAALGLLEAEARINRRGLWADANPVPPWTWRRPAKGRPTASTAVIEDATCHVGPRGGRYTLTTSGHKRYGC